MSSTLPSVSVETAVTIPIATITSVYASASSYYYSSLLPVMKTETNLDANVSYSNIGDELQATMSYYSLLEVQATATDPQVIVSVAAEAATASEVMNEIYKSNTMYEGKRPSLGGNLALAIVFGLMLVLQAVFGIMTKQWWFFVTYMCGIFLEVLGYSSRVWSHYNLNNFDAYVMQFVCITLAPCFLMAGIYFILAQLTVVMGQAFSILRPMQYSLIFIICDLISIVLQAAGGAMAAIELSDHKSTRSGSNVMVIGLAYQVFTMALFLILWFIFCYRCYISKKRYGSRIFSKEFEHVRQRKMFVPLFYSVTVSVILIFIRSIYRLIEMVEGFSSDMANNETMFMFFEALMVSLATLLMTIFHPGFSYGRKVYIPVEMNIRKSLTLKSEHFRNVARDKKLEVDCETFNDDSSE